jgi:hypothetical protein
MTPRSLPPRYRFRLNGAATRRSRRRRASGQILEELGRESLPRPASPKRCEAGAATVIGGATVVLSPGRTPHARARRRGNATDRSTLPKRGRSFDRPVAESGPFSLRSRGGLIYPPTRRGPWRRKGRPRGPCAKHDLRSRRVARLRCAPACCRRSRSVRRSRPPDVPACRSVSPGTRRSRRSRTKDGARRSRRPRTHGDARISSSRRPAATWRSTCCLAVSPASSRTSTGSRDVRCATTRSGRSCEVRQGVLRGEVPEGRVEPA